MMRPVVALMLLAAPALAGCMNDITPTVVYQNFDGDEAFALLEEIVYEADGSLRERRTGEPGHLETAQWLADRFDPPWEVRLVGGTGADYQALPLRSELDHYRQPSRCAPGDPDRVAAMEIRNVEAYLDNGHPDRVVILAAHWDQNHDTRDGTDRRVPAANDGASGVAVLITIQHALAQATLDFDVILLLTDAEDGFRDCHPVAGAALYAAQELDPDVQYRLILLDMVGDPDARFPRESYSNTSAPDMLDLLWDTAPAAGLEENILDTRRAILDDHLPFIDAGVPSVDIIDGGRSGTFPPYWETVDDTPDNLSAEMLERVGNWLLAALQDPRFAALWTDA